MNQIHQVSKKILILAAILIFRVGYMTPESVVAQKELYLKLKAPGFKPVEIGIGDFIADSRFYLATDQNLLKIVPQVIRDDLWYALFFTVIEPDSIYLYTFQKTKLESADWFALGARFYLNGELNFKADRIVCAFELREVIGNHRLLKDEISQPRGQERRLAHLVANAIVKQFTGKEGIFTTQLGFVSSHSSYRELYMCDFDGFNQRALTRDQSINLSPAFSPDGSRVLYTSYKAGNPDLWSLELKSGKSKKISARPGINSSAVWSPDGKYIALTLSHEGNAEIYLLDNGGDIIRRLTHSGGIDCSPSFSPDGSQIAFTSDRSGAPQIYITDVEGGSVNRVTFNGNYNDSPAWSPDGTQIAFVTRVERGDFDICTIDINGSNYKVLTATGSNENPRWSPDGLHIVFASNRTGSYQIYTMDFDGNNQRMVTSAGNNYNPTWSAGLK